MRPAARAAYLPECATHSGLSYRCYPAVMVPAANTRVPS
jgi:hypothetical protein